MKDNNTNSFNWDDAVNETYQNLSEQVVNYAPQLIGAVVLLLIGWLIAHILRLSTRKLVSGLDALFKKVSKSDSTKREQLKQSYTLILGQIVYWAVILFFVAASANLLGWNMFTDWMDSIVEFLPSLITGLLIILAGFLISAAARSAIASSSLGASSSQRAVLARSTQIIILFSAIIVGVEQIGLNMQFLTSVIIVTVGVLLAGACLAFGLGAKSMAANTIGAQYARKNCRVGEFMKIGKFEGEILEIRQTCIVLDTEGGRAVVPAKLFQEEVSILKDSNETPAVPQTDTDKEGKQS